MNSRITCSVVGHKNGILELCDPVVSELLIPHHEPRPPIAEPYPALADERFQVASEEELAKFQRTMSLRIQNTIPKGYQHIQ